MAIEWKLVHEKLHILLGSKSRPEEEQGPICAESNGAKLHVHSTENDDDGPHVTWQVTRPRKVLNVYGKICYTDKKDLKPAFARAKKLAEDFSLCWPNDSN